MRLRYSRRAISDLDEIATYYVSHAGPRIAKAIGDRLRATADRLALAPTSAPRLSDRTDVRVASVVRYPFRIFYRVHDDHIDILHVRHSSQQPPNFG